MGLHFGVAAVRSAWVFFPAALVAVHLAGVFLACRVAAVHLAWACLIFVGLP